MEDYLVRTFIDTLVSANSPQEAIEQVQQDTDEEPLYGPFQFQVLNEDEP